ncbi:NAD(P)-dependent oxidoreductase [Lactococcus lactis]|jgi:phosphoglycerate dehydrogenase-like enzyme|uniref:NAD(P)-dependent oxidoreductase n=1 Tax=Lactococcus lactis TaxID=1358 RepID=UPI0011BAF690|nr:NAD(P)-dependent oxidoreductase [Lactococcus lactis]MCZ8491371.1 NAD(P)-dependent oxidoreductase [Lactococcus lactis]MDG4964140.1 NAD(P)-binding domain-containing protein [Lactococcus lactis]QEA62081.1 hypothetical protein FGL73_11795 [Lactococcus lactis]
MSSETSIKTNHTIFLPQPIDSKGRKLLINAGYCLVEGGDVNIKSLRELDNSVSVIIIHGQYLGAEEIEAMPNLKIIARYGVGLDNIDLVTAEKKGIKVINASTANRESVADAVMMSILMLERNALKTIDYIQNKQWIDSNETENILGLGRDLSDLTIGIIGLGSIGIEISKRARAFGMRIIAYTPHEKKIEGVTLVSFEELIRESDIVSLSCPALPSTHHLINSEVLSKMKPTSFIVNFSRGSVIDTEALVLSLKLKQIAGAALDVYEIEPLPLDHELYKLNNVLLFPHFGTMTKDAEEKTAVVLSKRIIKALSMN